MRPKMFERGYPRLCPEIIHLVLQVTAIISVDFQQFWQLLEASKAIGQPETGIIPDLIPPVPSSFVSS